MKTDKRANDVFRNTHFAVAGENRVEKKPKHRFSSEFFHGQNETTRMLQRVRFRYAGTRYSVASRALDRHDDEIRQDNHILLLLLLCLKCTYDVVAPYSNCRVEYMSFNASTIWCLRRAKSCHPRWFARIFTFWYIN